MNKHQRACAARTLLACGLAAGLAAFPPGCGSNKKGQASADPAAQPQAGIEAQAGGPAGDDNSLASRLERDARDLQSLLGGSNAQPAQEATPQPAPADPTTPGGAPQTDQASAGQPAAEPQPAPAPETPAADAQAGQAPDVPVPPPAPAPEPAAPTPDEARAAAVKQLDASLRQRIATGARPWADALLLTALHAASPDLLPPAGDVLSSGTLAGSLSPPELASLSAAGALLSEWASSNTADPGNPALGAALLRKAADQLAPASASLRVTAAVLCSRVDGFGQYDPLPGNTFQAGAAARAVLYVEVDGFSHRAHTTPGRYAVELAQESRLVHDADGSLQWYKPEQPVLDVSRNKRRDFFLVQPVELPPTLSVGNYTLRITVRDLSGGPAESAPRAEAVVKLAVVAAPGRR